MQYQKFISFNFVLLIPFACIPICLSYNNNDSSSASNSTFDGSQPRALLSRSDEYVVRNQKKCFESRSLVACIKYKASKIVWKLATNELGYFPKEYGRELRDDKRRIRLIQLGQPSDMAVFSDARSLADDNEFTAFCKFLKRSAEIFGQNHGIQIAVASNSGARIMPAESENRGIIKKKTRKWLIILPLIILMKIAHLKMTMVGLLFAVLGLNVLLVGGIGWLIHYLKFKTLCKIHPQLVQHHSHVYDSDPSDYSSFLGSSFPSAYHSSSGSNSHEAGGNYYADKAWSTSKAYQGYNYLDTISKRIQ